MLPDDRAHSRACTNVADHLDCVAIVHAIAVLSYADGRNAYKGQTTQSIIIAKGRFLYILWNICSISISWFLLPMSNSEVTTVMYFHKQQYESIVPEKNQTLMCLVHYMTLICFLGYIIHNQHYVQNFPPKIAPIYRRPIVIEVTTCLELRHYRIIVQAWLTNEIPRIYHVMHYYDLLTLVAFYACENPYSIISDFICEMHWICLGHLFAFILVNIPPPLKKKILVIQISSVKCICLGHFYSFILTNIPAPPPPKKKNSRKWNSVVTLHTNDR